MPGKPGWGRSRQATYTVRQRNAALPLGRRYREASGTCEIEPPSAIIALMSDFSPAEQALQRQIDDSVVYARELASFDRKQALERLTSVGDISSLDRRIEQMLTAAADFGRTRYMEDAMRRAQSALEDAANLGLMPEGEAADSAPQFWGLDGDDWARLVVATRLRAGSVLVADLPLPL